MQHARMSRETHFLIHGCCTLQFCKEPSLCKEGNNDIDILSILYIGIQTVRDSYRRRSCACHYTVLPPQVEYPSLQVMMW